jgi:hypothetical protein
LQVWVTPFVRYTDYRNLKALSRLMVVFQRLAR